METVAISCGREALAGLYGFSEQSQFPSDLAYGTDWENSSDSDATFLPVPWRTAGGRFSGPCRNHQHWKQFLQSRWLRLLVARTPRP